MSRIPSAQSKSLSELSQAFSGAGKGVEIRAKGGRKDGVTLYAKTNGHNLFTNKAARAANQKAARTLISDAIHTEFRDLGKGPATYLTGLVQKNMRQFFEGQGKVTLGDLENVLEEAQRLRKDFGDFTSAKAAYANDPSYLEGKADYKTAVKDVPGFDKDQQLFAGIEQYAKLLNSPKPLTSEVLKQLGALEGWVREKSINDKDVSALVRATKALETAVNLDAESVKVLPQSVALRQIGGEVDQAGRCLPMVALAALAESNGPNGMDQLIRRFEQEVHEMHTAEKRDQTPYVANLARIHGSLPLSSSSAYIKDANGANIKSIGHRGAVEHLASNPEAIQGKPVFYGVRVPGHIMMIGATKHQGKDSFMFFDPNFGVARFSTAAKLSEFLDKYFEDMGYGDDYGMDMETNGRGCVVYQYDLAKVSDVPVDDLPTTDPNHVTMASLTNPKPGV